jgi:putative signal transducing protein
MDRDTLVHDYRKISDEVLIDMWTSGKLTELARDVAASELKQRGIDLDRLRETASGPDSEPEGSTSGFVTVYRTLSLSEAQLLRARLEVEGFPPYVADEHTVQTDQLLAPAMGGFRVRVPREMADEARRLLSEIQAGKLALDDDGEPAAKSDAATPSAPLWNPDLAAALSIVFTPVFGAILHALNWGRLRQEARARTGWKWAAAIGVVTIATAGYGAFETRDPKAAGAMLRLVLLLSLLGWYFGAARAQSKFVVNELKGRYVRASWFTPVWLAVIICSAASVFTPIFR